MLARAAAAQRRPMRRAKGAPSLLTGRALRPQTRVRLIRASGAHMATYKVGYLVGSLSSKSVNRLLAQALVRMAPPGLELVEIPIRELPMYSPDHDADYPP